MRPGGIIDEKLSPLLQRYAAMQLMRGDMSGFFDQHANLQRLFVEHIRTLVAVFAAPVAFAGLLVSTNNINPSTPLRLQPHIVGVVAIAAGVLAIFLLQVLARIRLDILMYARAINVIRGEYVMIINVGRPSAGVFRPEMPTDAYSPRRFEPFREMGLLMLSGSLVAAGYMGFGSWIVHHSLGPIGAVIIGFVAFTVSYLAYYVATLTRDVGSERRVGGN